MIALNFMFAALASSSFAPALAPEPRPDVEVIGPSQNNRLICRVISISNSRIPSRRVCRTQAEIEETRDRAQREAAADVNSTMPRSDYVLERSGYGNWVRAHSAGPIGEMSVAQTRRGGD